MRDRWLEMRFAHPHILHQRMPARVDPKPAEIYLQGIAAAQGKTVGFELAKTVLARCSESVSDTTRGSATAPRLAIIRRRVVVGEVSDIVTRFFSCNCRMASWANSSLTFGSNERCISWATLVSVVARLHASQAAPAVAFKAKTV
ncbi:MAG: hypothetical protein WBE76_20820 [Terracidiphilus sp.]